MARDFSRFASASQSNKRNTALKLEQLEARLLMAFDFVESQIDQLAIVEQQGTTSPQIESSIVNSNGVFASLAVLDSSGEAIAANSRIDQTSRSLKVRPIGLTVEGQTLSTAPKVSWIVSSTNKSARATLKTSGGTTTLSFSHFADYRVTLRAGSFSTKFTVRVVAPATSLALFQSSNKKLADNALIATTSDKQVLTVVGYSSSTQTTTLLKASQWSVISSPEGSSPTFQSQGNKTTIQFDRAGLYTFKVTNGSLSRRVKIQVTPKLTSLSLDSSSQTFSAGETHQFSAVGLDQFQQPVSSQPKITWSATGGTISSTGLYQAGDASGNFQVTARSGKLKVTATIEVVGTNSNDDQENEGNQIVGLNDVGLQQLMQTYYADGSISRTEMIGLLRSTATDNIVTATELADLRYVISTNSAYNLPDYVRGLARNVVQDNPANLHYQGNTAGNLSAGSSGTLLNQLVDKWFLGTDLPTLTSSSVSYRVATGNLFNGAPGLSDAQQGILGDCYFLASLVSIGRQNPAAIQNMFVDNGDNTFTVRFYAGSLGLFWQGNLISAGFISGSGVADYVTVDRNLPTFSNGALAYSGYGRSALSASTTLWLALAEKAYAQWNETGRSGRNGTNTYSGIEGGWMSDVNAQVLGSNSTYYVVNSSSKQAMINALSANHAVTIGTNPNASTGGLVGSHAYVVSNYSSANDTFTLYNPWGTQHPTPLTWTQLLNQTSAFVIADPSGALNSAAPSVQNSIRLVEHAVPELSNQETQRISKDCVDQLIADYEFTSGPASPRDIGSDRSSATRGLAQSDPREAQPIHSYSLAGSLVGGEGDQLDELLGSLIELS